MSQLLRLRLRIAGESDKCCQALSSDAQRGVLLWPARISLGENIAVLYIKV